ncbi:Uncharacterised protein [uncultured archaeon]|nr:Uncharacterised protein [uncultured archaeon]
MASILALGLIAFFGFAIWAGITRTIYNFHDKLESRPKQIKNRAK